MSFQQIVNRLIEGNIRFVTGKTLSRTFDYSRRKSIINRQSPFAVILSCADSRVVPEFIFDVELGELFVVRVIGNIANTSSIASVEYAIAKLNCKLIIVLGHQNCGAIAATMGNYHDSINLKHIINHIAPAIKSENNFDEAAKLNAIYTATELIKNSETIKNAIDSNRIKILSAFYQLSSGKVDFLDKIEL